MAIVVPDIACLREPNLLIPGKKPVGPVKIDWGHPLADRLQFYVNLGTSTRDLVTGERPSAALNPAVAQEWISGHGRGHDIAGLSSNILAYPSTKRLGLLSEFSAMQLVNLDKWVGIANVQDGCGNGDNNARGFRLFLSVSSSYARFRICDASSNLDVSSISGWGANDLAIVIARYKSGMPNGHNYLLRNLTSSKEIAGSKTTTASCSFSNYDFKIGQANPSATWYPDAIFHFTALWDKYLSDADVDAIKSDPYQFLIPA